jgi:hypothetical protein
MLPSKVQGGCANANQGDSNKVVPQRDGNRRTHRFIHRDHLGVLFGRTALAARRSNGFT